MEEPKPPTEIQFNFVKSNQHRVIHVDGAWGGVTASGGIHMSVYSERRDIPEKVVLEVEDGKPGKEKQQFRTSGLEVTREIDATLMMNVETAISIRDWLNQRIEAIRTAMAPAPQEG